MVKRESKAEFWRRVEREGRRADAEVAQAELMASGERKRAVQARLVARFQPTDGIQTTCWMTPDSWRKGRYTWRKPPPDSQEQFDRDVQWAHDNLKGSPEEAPTPNAALLLETAHKQPSKFLSIYLRCLPRIADRQQKELEERKRKVKERREAACRRANAQKRATYREAARLRAALDREEPTRPKPIDESNQSRRQIVGKEEDDWEDI